MASAQVLPSSSISSKKQQQLEAGRRRLKEYRRKKEAAKNAVSSNSFDSANDYLTEKKPLVTESFQLKDVGAGAIIEENENKTINVVQEAEPSSISVTHASPSTISSYNAHSVDPGQTLSADGNLRDNIASYGSVRDPHASQEEWNIAKFGSNAVYGIDIEDSRVFHSSEEDIDSTSNHINVRLEDALSNNGYHPSTDLTFPSAAWTPLSVINSSSEGSAGGSLTLNPRHNNQRSNGPIYDDNKLDYKERDPLSEVGKSLDGVCQQGNPTVRSMGDKRHSSHDNHQASESSSSFWSPESRPTSFRFDAVPSTNQEFMSPSVTGRSLPLFWDSMMSKNSLASLSNAETMKTKPLSPKVKPADAPISYASQNFMNTSVTNAGELFQCGGNGLDTVRSNDFYSAKGYEDFASLEQHIEDLTQEKFSLQRALEASQVLAESLSSENSALTDSYNQQGAVLHQLKFEMERLQEEIKAQLVELEAMRIEFGNAQLECTAADERGNLLASEVIGLEEKSLKLRSNELKLERQLENLQAEMSSNKRKFSSIEKEIEDLQSTIDALQEEKKLLQFKLQKAPTSGKLVDIKKSRTTKKEAATSTEDLVNQDDETNMPAISHLQMPSVDSGSDACSLHPQSWHFGLAASSLSIPPDQMRTIQNINTMISELVLEKEDLVRSLSAESWQSSKLKDLNKELSQKLEIQTQRLELLTARSMVRGNIPTASKSDSNTSVENTPSTDEGDEVVERVVGWLMKLFPSRQPIKHL
ncbi:hypothetical protein L6452_27398 [Arctium lappa]|uniref:Uncharacterized protein n=1 Tax=Arctium lappa TaxID=4217 RepID=A0ACB8ZX42_ARCLA|nr:hypothetical protein L6452_27398 [Arctium lappa]